jgi:hypothetical protein
MWRKKHTTGGIPRWSPTLVLVARFSAYVWQSGRDAQFSLTYGRMCLSLAHCILHYLVYTAVSWFEFVYYIDPAKDMQWLRLLQ